MTCVRLFVYFIDALSTRRAVRSALRSSADLVIFDRYIYDELANLTLANPIIRIYIRSIMKLVPRLDVSFILDADPAKARARKPEYPLDFLHKNRQSYLALSDLIGGMTVISPMPINAVKALVLEHGQKVLSFDPQLREKRQVAV
jgi:thymidylate kinase